MTTNAKGKTVATNSLSTEARQSLAGLSCTKNRNGKTRRELNTRSEEVMSRRRKNKKHDNELRQRGYLGKPSNPPMKFDRRDHGRRKIHRQICQECNKPAEICPGSFSATRPRPYHPCYRSICRGCSTTMRCPGCQRPFGLPGSPLIAYGLR